MPTPVAPTGNQSIDGLLWGWKWDSTDLTVSFPQDINVYREYAGLQGFTPFTQTQINQIANYGLNNLGVFTNLKFSPDNTGFGNLRFAQAQYVNYGGAHFNPGPHIPGQRGSAEANPPDPHWVPNFAQGDNWFTLGKYQNPILGSFDYAAGLLHEMGHALGLKHGHAVQEWTNNNAVKFPTLPAAENSQEFSIMTYSSHVGASVQGGASTREEYPWTYMMNDYAALQHMYGANFGAGSNEGDSVYRFDPNTGEMTVNNFGFGGSYNAKILITLWDGGGTDLYDFSNYAQDQRIDLRPGQFSTFSTPQLSNLSLGKAGEANYARGNVANPHLYQGDLRSLIENARSGSGNDTLIGNEVVNRLQSGAGHDALFAGAGKDTLLGEAGNDLLFGEYFSVDYATRIAGQVYRLYEATLDRPPDATGHLNWTYEIFRGAINLQQAANGFVGSQEFRNTYGSLDNSSFVELLYNNVLERPSDPTGKQNWLDHMAAGGTRANVVTGFSESLEFKNNTAADSNKFIASNTSAHWSDDVYRLYQATLDRNPDQNGFMAWTDRLGSGMSLEAVATGFVRSPEFQNTYGALGNGDFVELLYHNVLGRPSNPAGKMRWEQSLDNGASRESVVVGFSNSLELKTKTAAPLANWVRGLGEDDWLEGGAGNNSLAGGMLTDRFVFDSAMDGTNHVLDIEAWDFLFFRNFGYANDDQARSHMSQRGADVVFADQGVNVIIENTQLDQITDELILV